MIDLSFLDNPHGLAGMEFMDFQRTTYFQLFSQLLQSSIDEEGILDDDFISPAKKLIKEYCGWENVEIELVDWGNLCVDAGYINPGNVFNMKDIEFYLSKNETTLAKFFKDNKTNIFKGDIDFKTGKVSGAYAKMPFTIYINKEVSELFVVEVMNKHSVSVAQALAATITHELGHMFGGVMMIHQTFRDNLIMMAAIDLIAKKDNTADRVVILKDAGYLLEIEGGEKIELQKLAESDNQSDYVLYMSKMTNKRNKSRALSLGVPDMNSEVIADAYSVRMGCALGLVAGLDALFVYSKKQGNMHMWFMSFIYAVLFVYMTMNVISLVGFLMIIAGFRVVLGLLNFKYGQTSDVYNTDYRRLMDISRDLILQLKADKTFSTAEKTAMIKQIEWTLQVAEKNKGFFEGTIVQRMLGWMNDFGDFKYKEIEHYTQSLANHELNLLTDKFKTA